ncbi:hypothetical protein [Microbacterium binotii]|uniref:hypothetical protein n=1 Tax=Microbacterium binotii TaxID=462710 RepID=UPI001F2C0FF0|nr:hypothetical protein [Microbacterium binotii]UIN30916.1 hypothetical protein LXM64_01535 [Microbacterium binotii]
MSAADFIVVGWVGHEQEPRVVILGEDGAAAQYLDAIEARDAAQRLIELGKQILTPMSPRRLRLIERPAHATSKEES